MKAEIINVGSDIINGDRIEQNSCYISKQLFMNGLHISRQTNVGSRIASLKKALLHASHKSQLVIITGGLGPLSEDITTEAFCSEFNLKTVAEISALEKIKSYFAEKDRTVSDAFFSQAYIPKGSVAIPNDKGWAPGYYITIGMTTFVVMPGEFSQMQHMFDTYVITGIVNSEERVSEFKTLNVILSEDAELSKKISDVVSSGNPRIAPYKDNYEYKIKILSKGRESGNAKLLCRNAVGRIKEVFGENVYGENYDNIAEKTVELLKEKSMTVSTAESCTGGLVSAKIVSVAGASSVFEFGVCTYSNQMKNLALGVSEKTLKVYGAVSGQTAAEMAIAVKEMSGASIGVSVTGVAGPGQSENKPAGLVFYAIFDGEKVYVLRLGLDGKVLSRNEIRNITVTAVLDSLRRYLISSPNIIGNGTEKGQDIRVIDYSECIRKSMNGKKTDRKITVRKSDIFSDEEMSLMMNQIFNGD